MTWNQHSGGQAWRIRPGGLIEVKGEGGPRTEGPPISTLTLWQDYGHAMQAAACRFGLPLELLAGIMCVESVRESPDWWRLDARSYRKEPDGRESGGLMQTLVGTARQMNKKENLFEKHKKTGDGEYKLELQVDLQDLLVPERSIMLGAAYLAHLRDYDGRGWDDAAGDDPIRLCAAYNAGGVYTSAKNRWRLRVYGADRLLKFASYYNDFLSLAVG